MFSGFFFFLAFIANVISSFRDIGASLKFGYFDYHISIRMHLTNVYDLPARIAVALPGIVRIVRIEGRSVGHADQEDRALLAVFQVVPGHGFSFSGL
jgi:hypothetical protein